MKVLTSDAVQDPTKVEAKVRREVALRKRGHEKMNEERKLTDEQRREKIENKKVEEEKRGIFGAVFKWVMSLFRWQFRTDFLLIGSKRCPTRRTGTKCARTQSSST